MINYFTGKNFYKGNLHTHSTVSDGELSPLEIVTEYKKQGYDFLVFSEHEVYSNYNQFSTKDFITIQGVEFRVRMPKGDIRDYHFIVIPGHDDDIQAASMPMYSHMDKLDVPFCRSYSDIQKHIDEIRKRGYMVIFCHPFWSRIEYDEILPLNGFFAVEVYNHCSQALENMGESNVTWDALLRNNRKLWGVAVDDNHNRYPLDSSENDSFGGFICVNADALTERDICNAIAKGSFYASMGPEIFEFYVDNGSVYFSCSPVEKIYLNGHVRQIKHKIAKSKDELITEFSAKLEGNEKYVRMECYDINGRKAYTNPIFFDDM